MSTQRTFWSTVARCAVANIAGVTTIVFLAIAFAWAIAEKSFSSNAAAWLHVAPFVSFLCSWAIWTIVIAFFFGALVIGITRLFGRRGVDFERSQLSHCSNRLFVKRSLLGSFLCAAIAVGAIKGIGYGFYIGKLYQSVSFPGKSLPAIEVRYKGGLVESAAYAFLVGPIYRQEILSLEWPSQIAESENPVRLPAAGESKVAYSSFTPYHVHWSADGKRVGLSTKGVFVAAYDLETGYKIEVPNKRIDEFLHTRTQMTADSLQ